MILKFIIQTIISLVSWLINTFGFEDMQSYAEYIADFINLLSEFMQQAINFLYLVLGDSLFVFLFSIMTLLLYKYTIFPIYVIVRRFFIKGGDT